MVHTCFASAEEPGRPLGSLAGQSSLCREFQANERCCLKSILLLGTIAKVVLWHLHACMHTYMCPLHRERERAKQKQKPNTQEIYCSTVLEARNRNPRRQWVCPQPVHTPSPLLTVAGVAGICILGVFIFMRCPSCVISVQMCPFYKDISMIGLRPI